MHLFGDPRHGEHRGRRRHEVGRSVAAARDGELPPVPAGPRADGAAAPHRPLRADHLDVDAALPQRAVRAAVPAERHGARLPLPARARRLPRGRPARSRTGSRRAGLRSWRSRSSAPARWRRSDASSGSRGARTSRRSPRRRTASGRGSSTGSRSPSQPCSASLRSSLPDGGRCPCGRSAYPGRRSRPPRRRSSGLSSCSRGRGEHDDETLQRKALERVADELGTEVAGIDELTEKARELAWSSRGPESEEFDSFSKQAHEQGHVATAAGGGRRMRLPSIHRRGATPLADLGTVERPAGRTSLLRSRSRPPSRERSPSPCWRRAPPDPGARPSCRRARPPASSRSTCRRASPAPSTRAWPRR